MRLRNVGIFTLLASMSGIGCGPSDNQAASSPPPPPVSNRPACVISADCPSGAHCDLAECVQDCNEKDACTGELTCSPRARCLTPGAKDIDPIPSAQHLGDLKVTPQQVLLTEKDASFQVTLTSSSAKPVRYRVQLNAPHLNLDALRGEFTGSTTLTIKVDASKLHGRDVTGSLKIFTTLGDAVVNAPIHVGLTGSYRGVMRYDGGPVSLGDARLVLDLIEKKGDVTARIDSKNSLLFPATTTGETTGQGTFTSTGGVDLSVAQAIDPGFGGDRNHFKRALGRKIRMRMKSGDRGALDGTFEETVVGLFGQPITTKGTLHLDYQANAPEPKFTLGQDPPMPPDAKGSSLTPDIVFGWPTGYTCEAIVGCGLMQCKSTFPNCDCYEDMTQCESFACDATALTTVEAKYAAPLSNAMHNKLAASASPFDSLPTTCKTAVSGKSFGDATECGLLAPVACAAQIGARGSAADVKNAKIVSRLVSEMVAPALLVAKNEIVLGLSDSFAQGTARERQHYDDALATLKPISTWTLQAALLEYLRSMPPDAAKGDDPGASTSTATDTFPAARALADLFATTTTLDGERARLGAAAASGKQPALVDDAQHRAVLGFLEAAVLGEILRAWQTTPDTVKAKLLGVLSPLDRGFAALLEGANAFGVPSTFVPFVYRPEDIGKGPTNFEQVLAIAHDAVNAEKNIEGTFIANKRAYETGAQQVQQELAGVRNQFDIKLKEICGSAFAPEAIHSDADWVECGAKNTGEIGTMSLDIDAANLRVASSHSRIRGMGQKIAIDTQALADTQNVHKDTLRFISSTGDSLEGLTLAEGVISATMSAIQVASSAQFFNAGVPIEEAGVQMGLGLMKTAIEMQKGELQTAQTMRMEQAGAQIEMIHGMAEIQKEVIDVSQVGLDMEQDLLGVLQSQLKLRNKLAEARVLFEERGRMLVLVNRDPSNDPSFRLLRDEQSLLVLKARADAQRQLYLASSALEYELNMSIPAIDGAVLNAHNASSLEMLQSCLGSIYSSSRVAFGTPQDYVTTVSVRKMLGIAGPRTDTVTGQTLTEGEQFRQLVLRNENVDGRGGVGIVFATDLQPGNGLWSTDVCADRLATVQAQLVGDFLGDNQAQVNLGLSGASLMRACDSSELRSWSLGAGSSSGPSAFAVIQSGVNGFGDAPPNTSLFGQSVARASWSLVIPGGTDAPSNSDIDITHVDDVVLKFTHKALPRRSSPMSVDLSCLSVGGAP